MVPPQSEEGEIDETLLLSGFKPGAFFLDRYRLERLLGQGAMGKVFRAYDIVSDKPVALKVLHRELAKKDHVLARFRREFEILRELGHPGIVRVFDAGQAPDGMDYFVMELLEGENLKQRLQVRGPMSPEEFLPILVRVCDALGAAHVQDVVHRDMKPENLFLLDDGEVKVVDFGLSMISTQNRMTKTGMMLGTPRYMPPEQIRSAKDADARTDQYAVGVIAHEALAGASPFPAGDPGQLLGCVMEGRILTLEEQRPGIGKALGDVVRKAMSRDPKDRFPTIGAFVEAYAAAIGRRTGRSMLAESTGASDLFSLADAPDASGEIDLPADIVSSPTFEPLRFTVPPDEPTRAHRRRRVVAPPPTRHAPSKEPDGRLWWAVFVLALLAVTCVSASIALGVRSWLRSSGGIASPVTHVLHP